MQAKLSQLKDFEALKQTSHGPQQLLMLENDTVSIQTIRTNWTDDSEKPYASLKKASAIAPSQQSNQQQQQVCAISCRF